MINGEKVLRERYSDSFDEDCFSPNSMDLKLDVLQVPIYDDGTIYGLYQDKKVLPKVKDIKTEDILIDGKSKECFILEPHTYYFATTKERVKVHEDSGQIFKPRSTLLRSGVYVYSGWADAGFFGRLTFGIRNETPKPFVIERGARFAQLIDFECKGNGVYDGDYQEE